MSLLIFSSSGLATILYQSEAEQAEQCIVFCQGSWGGALNPLLWEATAIQSFALHFNNTSSARFTASSVIHYPPNASKKLMRGDRHIILSEAQLTQAPSCSVRSSLWEWLESAQHENATQDRSNIYILTWLKSECLLFTNFNGRYVMAATLPEALQQLKSSHKFSHEAACMDLLFLPE